MKHIFYILSSVLLFAACSKELPVTVDKPLPPAGMAEVTLGEIRLSDADATLSPEMSSATRAAGNLPSGSTLRLYAFRKGVTDFNNKLATRTYTVAADGFAGLDAGQDPLYLPSGEVDIYLVGPVAHNTGTEADPYWIDVASASSISPVQGVDLIAGYTPATIKAGNTNPLPAMTLVHKMSRVQVVVSRNTSGVYENLVVTNIKLSAQPQTGTFALDATGGTITPGPAADFTYPEIVTETLNEKYSGTALLFPQPEKELKIETTFKCNQINVDAGDNHPTLTYRQSGLISAALPAGAATRFSAEPLTPVEIKWRTKVLPWDTVDQGEIVIPGLDDDFVIINGLGWATGNLVANTNNTCKMGAPADYGIYFPFGSLVGWTGGADGSGVGAGTPALDKRVWPIEMGTEKPTFALPKTQGNNISTLTEYFFNYSIAPWETSDASSDIGTFAVSMPNDSGSGNLRSGRYVKLGVGDPCTYYLGAQCRLPTQVEMLALKNSGYSSWTQVDGVNGRWFGPRAGEPRSSIFLPAAGHRYGGTGTLWQLTIEARYGTCSIAANTSHFYMYIGSGGVNSPDKAGRTGGLPIRCVRDL